VRDGFFDLKLADIKGNQCKNRTRGIFAKRLTSKHSFQVDDVEFSRRTTGSSVPAFRIKESKRPNLFIVSIIAECAVPS
jgi:hypothetical protein